MDDSTLETIRAIFLATMSYIFQGLRRLFELKHGTNIGVPPAQETFMKKSTPITRGLIALIATAMIAQTSIVHAEMIGAEAVMSVQSQAEQDRAKVQAFVDRANVKERLQAMGVSGLAAKDRVAAMTEAEVHALAQRIDGMPAGGALSNNDLIIILLVAILVAILI